MGDQDFCIFLELKNKGSSFEGTNTLMLLQMFQAFTIFMFLNKMQYTYSIHHTELLVNYIRKRDRRYELPWACMQYHQDYKLEVLFLHKQI